MTNREPQPQGMRHKKFAVFILSNGRADNVITVKTLRKYGYTGDIKIICDNLDPQLPEYQKNYPDMVEVFDKPAYAKKIDTGINNDKEMRAIVYARNASYDIADRLGLTHFMRVMMTMPILATEKKKMECCTRWSTIIWMKALMR